MIDIKREKLCRPMWSATESFSGFLTHARCRGRIAALARSTGLPPPRAGELERELGMMTPELAEHRTRAELTRTRTMTG